LEVPRSDDVDKSRFLDVRLLDFEVTPVVSDTPSNWDGIFIVFELKKTKILIYQMNDYFNIQFKIDLSILY